MKKSILIVFGVCAMGLLLVCIAGIYKFNYLASQQGYDVDGNTIDVAGQLSNPQNATYTIDSEPVTLADGSAEAEVAPESVSKIVTKYFGNEVSTDVNNDGREDKVFLLTQSSGGSGTFYYVVAALNTENGWAGSHGHLLGDRVAPQTTELSQDPNHQNVIVVNYMDRVDGQAMSAQPSVGKSVWLKLDPETMRFGEVVQNFAGEADPTVMTLDMKPWTWEKQPTIMTLS